MLYFNANAGALFKYFGAPSATSQDDEPSTSSATRLHKCCLILRMKTHLTLLLPSKILQVSLCAPMSVSVFVCV